MGAMVVVAPQLLGGVPTWSVWLISALALGSLTFALGARGRGSRVELVALVAVGMVLWTGAQRLPLPCDWLDGVVPAHVHDVRRNAALLEQPAPPTCTLTRAPAATSAELLKGVALTATLIGALLLAQRGYRRVLLLMAATSGVLMASVTLGHALVDAHRVFGVYEPVYAAPRLMGPLLNSNNLAGLLVLLVPLAAVHALQTHTPGARLLWVAGAVLMVATVVLTLSRGGIVALLVTLLLLSSLLWVRRRGDGRGLRGATVLAGVLLGGLALGLIAAGQPLLRELRHGDLHKLNLLAEGARFALDAPWSGVGRGAFQAGFAEHFGTTRRALHAENFVIQWVVEWGWLPAAVWIGAVGYQVLRVATRSRDALRIAAACGITGLALHNLVDLGFEVLGLSVVASAVLGALLAPEHERNPRTRRRWLRTRPLGVATIALGLPLLLATPGHAVRVHDYQVRLQALLAQGNRDAFRRVLAEALQAHPAEPTFLLLGGVEAVRHGELGALHWLNASMQLAPGWAAPHAEAARLLTRLGHYDQAALELREAAARDPGPSATRVCELLRFSQQPELLARSAPAAPEARRILFHKVARCQLRDQALRRRVDEWLATSDSPPTPAVVRAARRHVRAGDTSRARRLVRTLARARPGDVGAQVALADTLTTTGDPGRALQQLREAERRTGSHPSYSAARARAHTQRGDAQAMRAAIEEMQARIGPSSKGLAAALRLRARLEGQLGHDLQVLHAYEEAQRLHATPGTWKRIARLARELGRPAQAHQAMNRLCAMAPDHNLCHESNSTLLH